MKIDVKNIRFKAWSEKGECLTDYGGAYLHSNGKLFLIDDSRKEIKNAVIELEIKE